jgi:hypothetical protein
VSELTDIDAVATLLGRTLTTAEEDRAAALIVAASAAIESYTGRRFTGGEHTVGRFVCHGRVKLPSTEVESVTAVRSLDVCTGEAADVDVYLLRGNTVYGLDWNRFVEVDYVATASVPAEVAAVAAGLVAATVSSPPVGLTSEQIGPFAQSFADSSGRVWWSKTDKLILGKYKLARSAWLV